MPLLETGGRVDEHQLILRVLECDPVAERELYDAHVDRVFRLAYRMTGDEELAQDLTQETFIRAFQRLPGFRGEAALSTWLHTIAVSVILNGLRKVRRNRQREVELEHVQEIATFPASSEPRVVDRLKKAIDGLSDRNRTVFVMHDIEGYTHEEIGSALRVTVGTSKATLSRAREKLREKLADVAKDYLT
ncbi:MAG TPA: RNA polymerase sigma factor [Longimicrobiaceae bacterium]|nr:RNA polymerase sigma factor [Longimicrobiaceae bacterium]